MAHFIIEAVERVGLSAFKVNWKGTGKAQYHPRMMLALLIYCYANGLFSSRRIERATYRDVGVRFVAADTHPDHDTIATFRRENSAAIAEAFAQVLVMGRELGLLKVGMVSIDGTKIDANASKIRSVRYDRAKALREQLEKDIAALLAQAEAADREDQPDPQALPREIARREALRAKLDAACQRLEAEARAEAEAQQAAYEEKLRAHEARNGRGRAPKPPNDTPPPDAQSNLTDPDSKLMRKSKRHEVRQAYNAQAVVDADGSQLVLATDVGQTPSDQPMFEPAINRMIDTLGPPTTVLGDAGYASGGAVEALEARDIEVLVAVSRPRAERPYDFRPPDPDAKPPPEPKAEWRQRMKEKLQTEDAKAKYKRRKCTVEPVFGIIKSVLGFTRFHLRGLGKVKTEWALVTLAYNCKRMAR
ncbi:transposase, partial [Roseospira visakhapatnamensis]|nr:transposase [Roseospira visakhapatnamensis]